MMKNYKLLFSVLGNKKGSLGLSFLFSFFTIFCNVALLTTSAWLITSAGLRPELAYLGIAIVGVRFFGISRAVCRYIERYVSHHMAFEGLHGLRVWFYRQIEPAAPAVFNRLGSADVLSRIMSDIDVLQFFYLRTLIPPVAALGMVAVGFIFMQQFSLTLVVFFLGCTILGGLCIPYGVYRYNARPLEELLVVNGQIKEETNEMISGLTDLIIYDQSKQLKQRLEGLLRTSDRLEGMTHQGRTMGNMTFLLLSQIGLVGGSCLTVPLVAEAGLSGVYIAVIGLSIQAYFEALQPLVVAWQHGAESMGALQRIVELKESKPLQSVAIGQGKETADLHGKDNAVSRGEAAIAFDGVSFGYTKQPIFKNLSVTIKKGEKVALIGPSGSGKSSLLHLLEGFYEAEGIIRIGGEVVEEDAIDSLRQQVALITQDTYIFHASLEDNIRLANPMASAEAIQGAIDFSGLRSFVDALPSGLATMIGSGEMGLSGGQRQRIALSRLYLRQAPILLLDEPLEGLDAISRVEIQQKLQTLWNDKTVIYVTHHLGHLKEMDRIIFMENGEILEDGTYAELLRREGPFYDYKCLAMSSIQ